MNEFHTHLERHYFTWHWILEVHRDDGSVISIADGSTRRRKDALLAAQSWQRVWLRHHGLLNL